MMTDVPRPASASARDARLAKALRANLLRRKGQLRARETENPAAAQLPSPPLQAAAHDPENSLP